MERSFKIKENWFEDAIRPAIFRRTLIALAIALLSIIWWLKTNSWVPLIVIVAVIIERMIEYTHIKKTKSITSDLNVSTYDNGLKISFRDRNQFYPWESLQVSLKKDRKNKIKDIQVVDKMNKFSKIKLSGLENIDELASIMLDKCNAP